MFTPKWTILVTLQPGKLSGRNCDFIMFSEEGLMQYASIESIERLLPCIHIQSSPSVAYLAALSVIAALCTEIFIVPRLRKKQGGTLSEKCQKENNACTSLIKS